MGLSNIRIVLVNPLYGGNVGSICRAMANTGLSDLALVDPGPLNLDEARMMACAANNILERRRVFPTLVEAIADCGLVVGTTARVGLYRSHCLTPREMAPRILDTARAGRVALVFGRENSGLTNDELERCTALIQIPSSPDYPSLNLSHAVLVCAYELFVAAGVYEPPEEATPEASSALRERMFQMWREILLEIGFMEEEKSQHMMLGLRRILSRGPMNENDVKIMMGIARQMRWKARHPSPPPDEPSA
jgi:TrmH family RNA methyltransferase